MDGEEWPAQSEAPCPVWVRILAQLGQVLTSSGKGLSEVGINELGGRSCISEKSFDVGPGEVIYRMCMEHSSD